MSKTALTKAGVVVLLLAAVFVTPSWQRGWPTYGLLLFGIANVFLDVPGTMFIRIVAAGTTFAVLVWQDSVVAVWATLLAWLMWPPAFMVAWALRDVGEIKKTRT